MRLVAPLLVVLALLPLACTVPPPGMGPGQNPSASRFHFALLEDYDKGDDLAAIARDFALLQELEIDTLRCSFGWDDYEPEPGVYDFAWLRQFVDLANQYGIRLRPYIAYTPEWARRSSAGVLTTAWLEQSAAQHGGMVGLCLRAGGHPWRTHPTCSPYEIYNEENTSFWWDGSVEQYGAALHAAAQAIRRADPDAQVLLGGLVYPDDDWLRSLIEQGRAPDYDVTPFHAYVETWSDTGVEDYLRASIRIPSCR